MRIIFVLGTARSGSTILASVMAAVSRFTFVGESRRLWSYWMSERRRCSCGALVSACPFWTSVLEAAGVDPAEMRRLPAHSAWYRQQLGRVFAEVMAATGAEGIIESSKHSAYVRGLVADPNLFEPTLVHIVRDPRGVAASTLRGWKKRGQSPPSKPAWRPYLRTVASWQQRNLEVLLLTRSHPGSIRLRYEDFVASPATTVERVLRQAGSHVSIPDTIVARPEHIPAGNPSRHEVGPLVIVPDEAWRSFSPSRRRAGYLAGLPLTALFRYPTS